MTTPQLPARPDLAQLKKQAKDLLQSARDRQPAALARFRALPAFAGKSDTELAATAFALHNAQSAVARELGFASWNALRERIEELTLDRQAAITQFTRGSVEQRLGRAERVLALYPDLVAADFHAALAFGEVAAVARRLAADPTLATRRGGPMNWEPLFYVAHSRWGTRNSAGLIEVARLLLAHGASPNASYAWSDNAAEQVSVLWAASCQARHLELARVLLEAGAKPDDGESVYHAAENGDTAMLDLLAAHGAQADGGDGNKRWQNTPLYFILGHYAGLGHDAAVRRGVAWLLAHGADPNRVCYPEKSAETPLHAAARHWDVPMIELLAQHGANLRAKRKDGRTAYVLAAMHGRTDIVAWLRDHDGDSDLSPAERFLAACMRGDRAKVDAMLRGEPRFAELTRDPGAQKLFFEVAGRTDTAALETMLACGFDPAATDDLGATPLHWAAFTGNLAGAKVLIAHGAPLDVRDRTHKSLLLGWADYAAANLPHPQGDYVGVVRALLAAGAALPTPEALESWASEELIALVLEAARQRSA